MISVIIPVWNHARDVVDCLRALEAQTDRDFEVIIVDDGSTDDVQARLQRVTFNLPLKTVRFADNRGAPAARNEGFRHAKGELVLFLDADAMLIPEALQIMRKTLLDHPDAAFAYPAFTFGGKRFEARTFDPEALKVRNYIHTSALIRRSAFPGFDEALQRLQDWDLWLTIAERGAHGVAIKQTLMEVRVDRQRRSISRWVPAFFYRLPWPIFGYMPETIQRYRQAEAVIKTKHHLI